MKKILIACLALTMLANAKYEVFKSQSREIGTPIKVEEIYFGEDYKFMESLKDKDPSLLIGGAAAGLTGGALALGGAAIAGAGIVAGAFVLVAGFDAVVKRSKMDQKYLLVNKITDAKGNVAFKRFLFIGSNGSDYTPEQIKSILGGK